MQTGMGDKLRGDKTDSTTIVIFGASGDLTHRKLVPALFSLYLKQRLPEHFRIVGFSGSSLTHDQWRASLRQSVSQFTKVVYIDDEWDAFAAHLFYQQGDWKASNLLEPLKAFLASQEAGPANRLYYLAVPPVLFASIIAALRSSEMVVEKEGWRRAVIEKPFGTDLASASALNQSIHQALDEKQIYRIDHYLGKESVQNLLVFRFANTPFEPIWNKEYIDHIQITVAEEVGVEERAGYYDGVGVGRDMFQNHLLQLLSLVAMEPPVSFHADDLRDRGVEVLRAIRPMTAQEAAEMSVRGQYQGYLQEEKVAPDSQTATFAAMRLWVDNPRWQGVPFYLRSGKRLGGKCTEIVVQFKCPPYPMFSQSPQDSDMAPNVLAFCIQPDEGIHLRFEAKVPDTHAETRSVDMEFHYRDSFGPSSIPEAYERLLFDALNGDPALFTRDDFIEAAWSLMDPILAGWKLPGGPPLNNYGPGSWGPEAAQQFLAGDGREWLVACAHDNK
jgi:glucose-6-phosphate 1-dehydrogenase